MSSRYWILHLDQRIRHLRDQGIPPKQIVVILQLTNVFVVYRSLRRLNVSNGTKPLENAKQTTSEKIETPVK